MLRDWGPAGHRLAVKYPSYTTYTTAWIGHVTVSSRNDVDMRMHHDLTSVLAAIGSHVEASDFLVLRHKSSTDDANQFVDVLPLSCGHVKPVRHMPFREDQCMAGGYWVSVLDGKGRAVVHECVCGHLRFAKIALRIRIRQRPRPEISAVSVAFRAVALRT